MSDKLMDKVGVMGLDNTNYPNEEHLTTIETEYLKTAINVMDELGWNQLDVCYVPGKGDYPLLRFKPPSKSLFAGENAGFSIAPRTEKGRDRDE